MSSQVVVTTAAKRGRSPSFSSGTKKTKTRYANPSRRLNKVILGRTFPDKITATLKYFELLGGSVTAGTTVKYPFRANGMFDPYAPLGGHQPYGFDQWTAIYNHWVVTASTIRVTIVPDAASTALAPLMVGIYNDDDTSNSLTYFDMIEASNRGQYRAINYNSPPSVIKAGYKSKWTFGNAPLADPSQRGTAAADPTETQVFNLWVANTGAAAAQQTFYVEIEYQATFFERKDLGGS